MYDLVIKNGQVYNPHLNSFEKRDIAVFDKKICRYSAGEESKEVIDATDCYVTPGIIDVHTHCFENGSGFSVHPDMFLSTGVTATIDAGSAGWSNYITFHNTIVENSKIKVKGMVAYNTVGQPELGFNINYDGKTINRNKIKHLLESYPTEILSLKMLFQKEIVGEHGLQSLEEMFKLAEDLGCSVTVHTTNPPIPVKEFIGLFRKGDTYCHCYQGRGNTILDSNDVILDEVWNARKRGVIFDAANGVNNFSFKVAKAGIEQGFLPDTISSDNSLHSFLRGNHVRDMPFIMSKYLALGVSLQDIFRTTTLNAAKVFKDKTVSGTLDEGSFADIAIFKEISKPTCFCDSPNFEYEINSDRRLVSMCTVLNGDVVYRNGLI